MFRPAIVFPITPDKIVLDLMESSLSAFSAGLTVQPKRPDPMTRRVVALRNDGGTRTNQALRSYGVNVWADSLVDAFKMCEAIQTGLLQLASTPPFTRVDQFSDPVEIDDDELFTVTVSGVVKNLAHVYFVFRTQYRGSKP